MTDPGCECHSAAVLPTDSNPGFRVSVGFSVLRCICAHLGTLVTPFPFLAPSHRNLGGVLFLDIRDSSGVLQAVSLPNGRHPAAHEAAERVRQEYVVRAEGQLRRRKDSNPNLATGKAGACVAAADSFSSRVYTIKKTPVTLEASAGLHTGAF